VKSNVTDANSACSARATASAWPGPLRKSGSPKEHDVARHDEEAPAVDGRDRAVTAEVLAAAARLDVARELEPPRLLDMRVRLQRRQVSPTRHREVELLEDGAGGRGPAPRLGTTLARGRPPVPPIITRLVEIPCELDQCGLQLAREDGVGRVLQEIPGVEGGVEAVEGDVTGRIHRA
jgi:hypothetical protein